MSYERDKIIGLIYRIFQAEDYQWVIDGVSKIPSFNDIEKYLQETEYIMEKEKLAVCDSGRIMVTRDKEFGAFNYYLDLGYGYGV
jgi:hypothetical protein